MPLIRILGAEDSPTPRSAGQLIAFALKPLKDCPAGRGVEAREQIEGPGDGD